MRMTSRRRSREGSSASELFGFAEVAGSTVLIHDLATGLDDPDGVLESQFSLHQDQLDHRHHARSRPLPPLIGEEALGRVWVYGEWVGVK